MYHAHLYYNHESPAQYELVEQVVQRVKDNFNFPIGRIHKKPVGPHPTGSCQVIFQEDDYKDFIPWLEENRKGLDVLIHKVTGDELRDHTEGASWLGGSYSLNLSIFTKANK